MALGILGADFLSTVSPTYAREILTPEGGHGLDGVLRLRADRLAGILNGIDVESWNPAADPDIAATFDAATLPERARNKTALQEEAGLEQDFRMPLLAVVSRLVKEKGFDIAAPAVRRWLERGGQFVLLGTGDPVLEHEYAEFEMRYPRRASVRLRFDARYARRVYAGADALLIPSRYEPCGLAQMIGMRYGCVPVARRTGGLADTVTDAGRARRHGDDVRRVPSLGPLGRPRARVEGVRSAREMGRAAEERHGPRLLLVALGEGVRGALRARSSGARFRHRPRTMRARAVILAGGEGSRLGVLTEKRAKPAVPFAGKYRIIDFTLSNCVNSGISDVMILTQYRPHSLNEHIASGRPWDLDRGFTGGVQIYQPYRGRSVTDWYKGTADAIAQNLSFVERGSPDLDPRSLRRPHLQDELRLARRVPPREAGRLHDRDAERHARRGHAHGHPGDRREPARDEVRREAGRPAGHARLDGHLRLRPDDARPRS